MTDKPKIDWTEIEEKQTRLKELIQLAKSHRESQEYIEECRCLRQVQSLRNELTQQLEQAKRTANQNVKDTLEKMLSFITQSNT